MISYQDHYFLKIKEPVPGKVNHLKALLLEILFPNKLLKYLLVGLKLGYKLAKVEIAMTCIISKSK